MMKKLFFIFWLSLVGLQLKAQTSKPAVLVVGNGNAAIGAAIQAAVSGVKTTILLQAGGFDVNPIGGDLNSGIQAEFLRRLNNSQDKQIANEVLTKWTDTLKNLTVIKNALWVKADRSGSSWSFKLNDGQTIKARILINAGDVKLQNALKIDNLPTSHEIPLNYDATLYRTSVAAGKQVKGTTATVFSMYNFFIPEQENLLWLKGDESMLIGQAAGATAAYAGFFGVKTSEVNLKAIQGELINYKLALMPFADVKHDDPNWKAIQFVGVTGIIKGNIQNTKVEFSPNSLVTIDDIKQPIKDFYYKAQIWFDDYKGSTLTLKAAIELICYVGQKSRESTPKEIEKKWKATYKLDSDFDLNKQINRRELAVILHDYMPPFNVNVDKNGKVIR